MIQLAKMKVDLPVPVSEIYNYVTNMENYPQWFPGALEVKRLAGQTDGNAPAVFSESIEFAGTTMRQQVVVVEQTDNKRFVTQGDAAPLLTQMEMNFNESGAGCLMEVTYWSRQTEQNVEQNMLNAIQTNLAARAQQAAQNLKKKFSADSRD